MWSCTGYGSCRSLTPVNRICPGKVFALRTQFLNIACTLAVFDIEAPAGEKLEPKFREYVVRYVIPFEVSIKAS